MVTDAQKKARNKWDAANMTMLRCKIRKTEAEAFEKECQRRGTTRNAVMLAAIRRFMAEADSAYTSDDLES